MCANCFVKNTDLSHQFSSCNVAIFIHSLVASFYQTVTGNAIITSDIQKIFCLSKCGQIDKFSKHSDKFLTSLLVIAQFQIKNLALSERIKQEAEILKCLKVRLDNFIDMRRLYGLSYSQVKLCLKSLTINRLDNLAFQDSSVNPIPHNYYGKSRDEVREIQLSFKPINREIKSYCKCESCCLKVTSFNVLRPAGENRRFSKLTCSGFLSHEFSLTTKNLFPNFFKCKKDTLLRNQFLVCECYSCSVTFDPR